MPGQNPERQEQGEREQLNHHEHGDAQSGENQSHRDNHAAARNEFFDEFIALFVKSDERQIGFVTWVSVAISTSKTNTAYTLKIAEMTKKSSPNLGDLAGTNG